MSVVTLHALLMVVAAAVVVALDRSVGPQRAGIGAGVAALLALLVSADVLRVADVPSLDAWLAGAAAIAMAWLLITARRKAIIIAAALGTWSGVLIVLLRFGWIGRTGLRKLFGGL
jgi:hypothetical protein